MYHHEVRVILLIKGFKYTVANFCTVFFRAIIYYCYLALLRKRFDYIFEAPKSGIYIFDSKTNLKLLLYALLVYL